MECVFKLACAYGADDDFLRDDKNQYAEFVKIRGTHPRYRWLIQGSEASAPYIENSFGIMSRPNLRFSDFIGRMNGLRTSRILENKASKWQILAFAHGTLKCELSKEQKVRLAGVGFDPASQFDINKILNDLNIKPLVWRTQNFAELGKVADYEHQSGFSYLSISTSMAILTKRAVLGDSEFQRGLQRIDDFVKSNYTGDYLDFFSALNKILHDPERFSNSYPKNLENFCPRLSQIFTDEYMSSNIH